MDCRETRELLTAFHDGELPAADRVRVEEHLRGCLECSALLAAMARADAAAGVPDPGPGYWERFNACVADRVARDAERAGIAVLRPKGGWVRQQLRYLVPAVAAAALVVMVVRYGALGPGPPAPAVPPAVGGPGVRVPDKAQGEPSAEKKPEGAKRESASVPRRSPAESGRVDEAVGKVRERPDSAVGEASGSAPPPAPPPAVAGDGHVAFATREERERMEDRAAAEKAGEDSADRAAAPGGAVAPSTPVTSYRAAPPPAAAKERVAPFAREEGRKAAAPPPAVEVPATYPPQAAARAETSLAKEIPKDLHIAPPCERARTLAARDLWKEAEAAQRECLAQDRSAPAQEKGLVFLAELLDRQARFADADAVIEEVRRQFPRSVPLDLYRQQRPMVQQLQSPPPAGR